MTEPHPEVIDAENSGELAPEDNGEGPNGTRERLRATLRAVFAVALGALMMGDVALYSLYKSVQSRVESQDRRIERMNKMLTDLLASRDNAAKIEEIEQQVDGIETAVGDLTQMVKDQRTSEQSSEDDKTKSKK